MSLLQLHVANIANVACLARPLQFPYRKPFVDIPIDRGATQGNDFIYPPISAKFRRLALIMLNVITRNCLVVVPSIQKRLRFAWISY
jgi:hypothetical protein